MTTTRIPKARVRVAIWVDPSTERYRALVLVAGGQDFRVGSTSLGLLDHVVEHQLNEAHGDNWEFVRITNLGRVETEDTQEIARLLEKAS